MIEIKDLILKNLVNDEKYTRHVLPYIKNEYFDDFKYSLIFTSIKEFHSKYNKTPSKNELLVILAKNPSITNENTTKEIISLVRELYVNDTSETYDWLVKSTEEYCQEKALYNAILQSVNIMDNKKSNKMEIPKLLQDALSVSFDSSIGHDYFKDIEGRFNFYHRIEEKIGFDIDILNIITKGGVAKKTLNIILAPTSVGKSMTMCHMAANNILQGKNVLYITLEMAAEYIAQRIDMNLLDLTDDQIMMLSRKKFIDKISPFKDANGSLIVKEYPASSASVMNFKHLIDELRIKNNFVPDIVYVDYINLCTSTRVKSSENSYAYVKAIAEELRGMATEKNIVIWSATQTNRAAQDASDYGLEAVSESSALSSTADLLIALISTAVTEELGQLTMKILKNRYHSKSKWKTFVVGLDRDRMRLTNIKMQNGITVNKYSPHQTHEEEELSEQNLIDTEDEQQNYLNIDTNHKPAIEPALKTTGWTL